LQWFLFAKYLWCQHKLLERVSSHGLPNA
jgi:hypothetical protein